MRLFYPEKKSSKILFWILPGLMLIYYYFSLEQGHFLGTIISFISFMIPYWILFFVARLVMNLKSKIFGTLGIDEYKSKLKIGRTEDEGAVCPYCQMPLKKFPKNKTKCPSCCEHIYSRTRPSDNKKVLLTSEGVKVLEEEMTKVYGAHDDFLKNKNKMNGARKELEKQFEKAPSEGDVVWRKLNKEMIQAVDDRDWHDFVKVKRDMALFLNRENRYKEALVIAFEVCHFDCNQLYNGWESSWNSNMIDTASGGKVEVSSIPGGIFSIITSAMKALNLSAENVEELFFREMDKYKDSYQLPIGLKTTWSKISEQF